MGPSARKIVELNIRHLRTLLETEKGPTRRVTIERLLAEHERILAELVEKESDQTC